MDQQPAERIWADRFWTAPDGLQLHFRDYPGRKDRPPVLCMHGLTRNARDFGDLAEHLAGEWRVIVPEMRGRGESDYAREAASYNPMTYVADVEALLEAEGIERVVAIGTSLGGLMTMLMAARNRERLAGAVLNDIGPELRPEGISRIRDYVGQGRSFPTWMHAARALEEVHGAAFPRFGLNDWLGMAKRCMVLGQNGRISFDYDMSIAEPFADDEGAAPPNLWPAYEALAGRPVLLLRGELSNLFSEEVFAEMQRRIPDARAVTVGEVGHAPLLDELEALRAIDEFLARIA